MRSVLRVAIVVLLVAIPLFVVFSLAGFGTFVAALFALVAGAVVSAGVQLIRYRSKASALAQGEALRTIEDVQNLWLEIDRAIAAYPDAPAHGPLGASVQKCLTSIRKNSTSAELNVANDYRLSALDRILSNYLKPSVELYSKVAHNARAKKAFNDQLTVLQGQVDEITEELDHDALSQVLAQSELLSTTFNDNMLDLPRN